MITIPLRHNDLFKIIFDKETKKMTLVFFYQGDEITILCKDLKRFRSFMSQIYEDSFMIFCDPDKRKDE